MAVPSQVVTYAVDKSTTVRFEIDPVEGFRPAGPDEILGRVREAAGPAVGAAKAVLDQVKKAGPRRVELKFGLKASGTANWLVAKAATEGNFEVTLTWEPGPDDVGPAAGPAAAGHEDGGD